MRVREKGVVGMPVCQPKLTCSPFSGNSDSGFEVVD